MIPLARPDLDEDEIKAAAEVLRTGQLIQGPKVAELEAAVAKYIGCKHAVAVSSGTAALHLALLALQVGPGDEVLVPDFTFPATANAVEMVGAVPVMVDIDLATFNLDAAQLEKHITPRTKAIMPVHEFGCPADMDAIRAVAKKHKLLVIEDAACALGTEFRGKKVGTLGDAGCFSLHPRKAITTGEGGFVTSTDDKTVERVRLLRNHGMERNLDGKLDFVCMGYNYRLTEFQAAIGLVQMAKLEKLINKRRELACAYSGELQNTPLRLPGAPEYGRHVYQTYHVLLPDGVDRDWVIRQLNEKGIGSNYGANALHLTAHHKKFAREHKYPAATQAYQHGLALPLFCSMTQAQQKEVCQALLSLLKQTVRK